MFRNALSSCLAGLILCLAAWAHAQPQAPQRVISMSPNITETVFALGAGDRLVGVTDFCNYPEAARSIRRAGGWSNPNFEVITALHPDLILFQGRHQKLHDFTTERGMRAENVEMDSAASIRAGILKIGHLLGVEDQATSLTAAIDTELARLRLRVAAIPLADRPRVYLSLSRQAGALESLFTVSNAGFIGEALEIAGGVNVFGSAAQAYTQAAKESLLAARPEMIIEILGTDTMPAADRKLLIQDWNAFPMLPATRDGRIVVIAGEYTMIPGPRFVQLVRALQDALYPDLK